MYRVDAFVVITAAGGAGRCAIHSPPSRGWPPSDSHGLSGRCPESGVSLSGAGMEVAADP